MEFRDQTVTISEGEFIIVPRGVEHRPNAKDEVQAVLFEPGTTLNTGNVKNERRWRSWRRYNLEPYICLIRASYFCANIVSRFVINESIV